MEEKLVWQEIKNPSFFLLFKDVVSSHPARTLIQRFFGTSFWIGVLAGFPFSGLAFLLYERDEVSTDLPVLLTSPLFILGILVPLVLGMSGGGFGVIIQHLLDRMRNELSRDYLTDLYSHRFFRVALRNQLEEAHRYEEPLSLLLLDLDHFKRINDEYGHPTGDRVLRVLASKLRATIRSADVACRYGGEEFVVILPQTSPSEALTLAERIRKNFEQHSFKEEFTITVSGGIASYPDDGDSVEDLIHSADQRLYRAKEGGRNRIRNES